MSHRLKWVSDMEGRALDGEQVDTKTPDLLTVAADAAAAAAVAHIRQHVIDAVHLAQLQAGLEQTIAERDTWRRKIEATEEQNAVLARQVAHLQSQVPEDPGL